MPTPRLSEAERRRRIEAQLARTGHRGLARIVERNIATICEIQDRMRDGRSRSDRLADRVNHFAGSMGFVYVHAVWFAAWIAINLGWTPLRPFDPFPFGLLTMVVSLEAIFLSTFILVSQNRMSEMADKRADLDLQINLLAEYEVTRVLKLVDAIADHFGLEVGEDPEVEELKEEVSPEIVMDEMDRVKQNGHGPTGSALCDEVPPSAVVSSRRSC